MDLEELTKHQIILLTLLVSFVTSLATGIVTVSLMQQAPPSVTRTINQIVEHTVETVVPASPGAQPQVTTTKTVVVKDDDQIAQSIAAVQKSIIRITAKGSNDVLARGIIIDQKGTVLTDSAALENSGATSFEATLADGSKVPLAVKSASTSPLAVASVPMGTSSAVAASPLADPSKIQLGNTVIRIGGKGVDSVGEGIVAQLPGSGSDLIEASVQSSTPGSVLISRFGEVIGIATADSLSQGADLYTLAKVPALTAPKAPETKTSS